MNKRRVLAFGSAAAVTLIMAVPAFAAEPPQPRSARSGVAGIMSMAPSRHALFGIVQSAEGTSFALTRALVSGPTRVMVVTDSDTVFKKNGSAVAPAMPLPGQLVVVLGSVSASGAIEASRVNIMDTKMSSVSARL